MNALFITNSADRLIREMAPAVPQQVQQLAHQIGTQTQQQMLDNVAYYGLLAVGLMAAISLLVSSLVLILRNPLPGTVQSDVQPILRTPAHKHPVSIRRVETCIARANRNALRAGSARLRAGQLSN